MGDDEDFKKIKTRVLPSQGSYSVRASEEELNLLQKENFNLKLKLFFLENKHGIANAKSVADISSIGDREYFELFLENETLKKELQEKQEIMKNALHAIEMLEEVKAKEDRKSKMIIEEQSKKIDTLKTKSKILRKAKRVLINPSDDAGCEKISKIQEDFRALRSQNSELFGRINAFKKEMSLKNSTIENLVAEKREINKELEGTRKKLNAIEKKMFQVRQELSKEVPEPENLTSLKSENEQLHLNIKNLIEKCEKLEKKTKEFERLIGEQSSLMKALNRTIEAKNEELKAYKIRKESGDASSVINLTFSNGDTENSQFPFHNPLFGNITSQYR